MVRSAFFYALYKSPLSKTLLLVAAASLALFFAVNSSTSAVPNKPGQTLQPSAEQRALFRQTYAQLTQGQLLDLSEVLIQLDDYPLAPYLKYQLFRNQIAYQQADPDQLFAFLQRHQNTAFYPRLRDEWLTQLGRQENWATYLAVAGSEPLNQTSLECYRLQAEGKQQGKSLSWLETSADFWRTQQPLPAACEAFSQSLKELGFLTQEDVWQAAIQLMRAGQTQQAWQLREALSSQQRQQLDHWRRGRLNPERFLQARLESGFEQKEHYPELNQEILQDIIKIYARSHPSQALKAIHKLTDQKLLSASKAYPLYEHLALRAAWRNAPEALTLFAKLPSQELSTEGKEWLARTQLRLANWPELITAIQQLPQELRQTNQWRYWLAQAYQATGQPSEAQALLEPLAQQRNYYGFLAARELGQPPAMNAQPASLQIAPMQALYKMPGIQRAGELFMLGLSEEARREWHHTLSGASPATWQQAAWLAQQWGWYDRSINAIHNAGQQDALELRFPLAYLEQLQPLAAAWDLDPALLLALIRKESLFNTQARSRVGALGLMQVMPATGQEVSRQLQTPLGSEGYLLKPEYNLPIGVSYLAELMQRFQNDPIIAAAAYNAGPSRAAQWQQRLGTQTSPHWVEQITFAETRDYVKSVLAFREVYAWRLQQHQLQLSEGSSKQPKS